jgi:CHAT domain
VVSWTELLAVVALGFLAAALVVVPVLLLWSRSRRRSSGSRATGGFAAAVVNVVQAVTQSLLATQIGMVSELAVVAIGFLRVRLKAGPGAELLAVDEESPPVITLAADYHLELRHQGDPPASYHGAAVQVVPVTRPQRLDLVVEGDAFTVSEGGLGRMEVQPSGIAGTSLTVRPVKTGPASLRIDCYRDNAWLQAVDLRLEVRPRAEVAQLKVTATPVADLEGSATVPAPAAEPAPRHLHLRISRATDPESGRTYSARMSDGRSGWHPLDLKLGEEDLRDLNRGLRLALEDLRRLLGDAVTLGPEERSSEEYRDRLDLLARRGNYAFQQIFPEPADQELVRAALAAAEGGGGGLEIAAQNFILPWEALYEAYDPAVLADPKGFWGFRFAISRILTDVRQSAPPVLECDARPRISLFADPELPAVAAEEVPNFRRLSQEGRIALREWPGEAEETDLTTKQQRARLIELSRRNPADVAHFACHAVAADYGPDSFLSLPEGLRLRLEDLAVERFFLAGAPFVVLNACGTGIRDPLKTADFVHRFLLSGSRGVVVTECDVPDGFAAAFVRQLYDRMLAGEPLVAALRAIRERFLVEHGNPLGLLYSAYLSLEARLLSRAPENPPREPRTGA